MRPNHEHRVSVITEGVAHYQDLGQVTPSRPHLGGTVAELLANFTIFTATVGPRWFGTAEADVRAQYKTRGANLRRGRPTVFAPQSH